MFAAGETVTRRRGTPVLDPYSQEETGTDWKTPDDLEILDCAVADGGSLEPLEDARNAVVSDFDVIAPFGSDVTARDRLVIRGLVCEVVARPFDWRSPFTGWQPGTVIKAKIVEG